MHVLKRTQSSDEDFKTLISLLDEDLDARYGILQKQYTPLNQTDTIKNVIIAYVENQPAGCGSFKAHSETQIEIKRMFVKPESRGTGIAGSIMTALENWALELGYSEVILETGILQHEAIRFYKKSGYKPIDNYGPYIGNSNSVCMMKNLQAN